ncbi:MAG: helix-turn-helix domain-containing protein [Planctomycetes bacterium]|nr:helix-turn-helix domain-containing protein [Planctomycetota bacterium]
MDLTPKEAARYLGKSERMVRYLLKSGKLPGRKQDDKWRIPKDALEPLLSDQQRAERRERVADLRERLDQSLGELQPAAKDESGRSFYSVRDVRLFGALIQVLAEVEQLEAPALARVADSLRACLRHLADGIHQFEIPVKLDRLTRARTDLCTALADLLVHATSSESSAVVPLADRIEGEMLRSLNGLLRRVERRRRRPAGGAA